MWIHRFNIIIFNIKYVLNGLERRTKLPLVESAKEPGRRGRGSLKAPDTHRFSMFRAWRIAIIQNEMRCLFRGSLVPLFWITVLRSSKRTSARIVTSVRMTNKNALSYPANKVILWSYDHAIDGRHLSASRSDANRSFDEETRAICRVHEVCRNFIRQTRILFFFTSRCKSQTSR